MTTPHVANPSSAARDAAAGIVEVLKPGLRIALTTHVNADGDGVGSEVALWHVLTSLGLRAAIANPTPYPARFDFLMAGYEEANKSDSAARYIKRADLIMVLDISDLSRLGHLGRVVEECSVPVICIDHHLSNGTLPDGPRLIDAGASATGELVYHLMGEAGWAFNHDIARALYVAILTDTGGFRFSNTTPGTLRVAADLLEREIDPEEIYRMVYASNPEGRVRLLGEVVQTLVVEEAMGLAWITVPEGALERHSLDPDQLEGIVELPRSIDGVRLALLFRTLANGRIKVSFRSVGGVNVAELAETFGGGGHRRASGASLEGTLAEVQNIVLAKAREALQ